MKTFFISLLALLCTSVTTAQKIPSFGKIDKADLLYKECSYDKDAAAEYLIDYGEVNYFFSSSDFFNETKFRVRIKILKEKGVELANVRIPYFWKSKRQIVNNIEGFTYNLDEKGEVVESKMEKKSVMTQKVDENWDMEVFTLPNVKVGSVIEYRYTISKKNYIELDDWIFQREYPVRYSEYNAAIPDGLVFTYLVKRTLPVKETTEGKNVKRFIMINIPGLDKEPYMSCAKDYYQRIDFQLSSILNRPVNSTWKEITEELLNDESFGDQLKKNILKTLPLANELKNLTTDKAKIQAVYNYVKKTVTWNGRNSISCRDGIKTALEKNTGNSAEINLLVINLLRDAGITAYPILVSTRPHGKVNTLYPFINQFDNVYIYTEANGIAFILDATNPYNPDFMVPWDVQFTDGFIVDTKNGQFISLSDTKHRFKINTFLQAEIDEQGILKGTANVLAYEYAKNRRLSSLNKGKENYVSDYFKEPVQDIKVDSVTLKNEKVDSLPLENMVTFQTQLNNSAEYYFVTPNLFSELGKNEFISDQRFTDIEFGFVQYYNISGIIRFPNSMEAEELPKNIKMILPDTSIVMQRFMEKNENSISFRITLEIKRPTYYAEEYPDFKAFYSVLFEKLNEQIVFKKKAKPKP